MPGVPSEVRAMPSCPRPNWCMHVTHVGKFVWSTREREEKGSRQQSIISHIHFSSPEKSDGKSLKGNACVIFFSCPAFVWRATMFLLLKMFLGRSEIYTLILSGDNGGEKGHLLKENGQGKKFFRSVLQRRFCHGGGQITRSPFARSQFLLLSRKKTSGKNKWIYLQHTLALNH